MFGELTQSRLKVLFNPKNIQIRISLVVFVGLDVSDKTK